MTQKVFDKVVLILHQCLCDNCNYDPRVLQSCSGNLLKPLWRQIIVGTRYLFLTIWLLLSTIFTFAVFIKTLQLIKLQYKAKQKTLSSFVRISFGLLFSAFIFFWYFLYNFTQELLGTWIYQWLLQANVDSKIAQWFPPSAYPTWISILSNEKQSLNNLRVFIECMLALTILTAYRECFVKSVKNFVFYIVRPMQLVKTMKAKVTRERVTSVVFVSNFK